MLYLHYATMSPSENGSLFPVAASLSATTFVLDACIRALSPSLPECFCMVDMLAFILTGGNSRTTVSLSIRTSSTDSSKPRVQFPSGSAACIRAINSVLLSVVDNRCSCNNALSCATLYLLRSMAFQDNFRKFLETLLTIYYRKISLLSASTQNLRSHF